MSTATILYLFLGPQVNHGVYQHLVAVELGGRLCGGRSAPAPRGWVGVGVGSLLGRGGAPVVRGAVGVGALPAPPVVPVLGGGRGGAVARSATMVHPEPGWRLWKIHSSPTPPHPAATSSPKTSRLTDFCRN